MAVLTSTETLRGFAAQVLPAPRIVVTLPGWFDSNLRAALIGGGVVALLSTIVTVAIFRHQVDREDKQDAEKASEDAIAKQLGKFVDPAATREALLGNRLTAIEKDVGRINAIEKNVEDLQAHLTRIDDKVSSTDRTVSGLASQIAEQSKTLDRLHRDVIDAIKLKTRGAISLPPDQLAAESESLLLTFRLAKVFNVDVDFRTLREVRRRLGAVAGPVNSDYWQLTSYVTTEESQRSVQVDLPRGPQVTGNRYEGNFFTGRHVVLDGSTFMGNAFWDCVVEYRGGPVVMKNNLFNNCIFILRFSGTPPEGGQRLIRQLITSTTLANVRLAGG